MKAFRLILSCILFSFAAHSPLTLGADSDIISLSFHLKKVDGTTLYFDNLGPKLPRIGASFLLRRGSVTLAVVKTDEVDEASLKGAITKKYPDFKELTPDETFTIIIRQSAIQSAAPLVPKASPSPTPVASSSPKPSPSGKATKDEPPGLEKSSLGVWAGIGSQSYTETFVPDYSSYTASLGARYDRVSSKSWLLQVEGAAHLIALQASSTTSLARFFWLDGGARYNFTQGSGRFKFKAGPGIYYTTTYVSDNSFGYQNLFGPEITAYFQYEMSKTEWLELQMHFAAIKSSASNIGTTNADYGFGVIWNGPTEDMSRIFFKFENRYLSYKILSITAQLSSWTLGVGYRF